MLLVAITLLICSGLGALVYAGSRRSLRRVRAARSGETFDDFRAAFPATYSLDVLHAVYKGLQDCLPEPDVPIRPEDALEMFGVGIDGDEISEFVEVVREAIGIEAQSVEWVDPILTVADLVAYIQELKAAGRQAPSS